MQTTANYGLKKPEGNDTVDIDVINGNMDTIDGELKKLSNAMGDDPDFKTTLSNAISVKANQADFNNHVNALTAHGIGDRTQLKTAAKDTIVNALNELKTAIPNVPVQSVNGKTGNVSLGASDIAVVDSSNHFSSNPKNVENVLSELFTSGTNGKNDIYNAISAKGTTPASKNFADLVSAIGNISTGKKYATGTKTSTNSFATLGFTIRESNSYEVNAFCYSLNLSFSPSFIISRSTDLICGTNDFEMALYMKCDDGISSESWKIFDYSYVRGVTGIRQLLARDQGANMTVPCYNREISYTYYAFE